MGVNKFLFRADPPDLSRIPNSEIIGVTVILLSCSYEDREFVRVGYYVNNEYVDEALALEPPAKPVIEKVQRQILAEKPRVTRFAIKWYVALSQPSVPELCTGYLETGYLVVSTWLIDPGILRSLHRRSSLLSSPRPTLTQTAINTVLKRRKKRKRRLRVPLRKARTLQWLAGRRPQAPQPKRRKAIQMAVRTLILRTLKAKMRTKRRAVTTIWRWMMVSPAPPTETSKPSNSPGAYSSTTRT